MALRQWSKRTRVRIVAALLILTAAAPAFATDAQVREAIIRESIAKYHATGHPCACPYDLARNGSQCGGRSAYRRLGGASPLCYPKDVSDGMVADWRRAHP
jgi:hypothetical protein